MEGSFESSEQLCPMKLCRGLCRELCRMEQGIHTKVHGPVVTTPFRQSSRQCSRQRYCQGAFAHPGLGQSASLHASRTRNRAGLTLVEVLLALVILGIGLSGLVAATSSCLAVVRKAKNLENARRLIAQVELVEPIFMDDIEAGSDSGSFPHPFENYSWERMIELIGEEEDGLFMISTRVLWSRRGKQNSEDVVTYLHAPEEVEGGSFESAP